MYEDYAYGDGALEIFDKKSNQEIKFLKNFKKEVETNLFKGSGF